MTQMLGPAGVWLNSQPWARPALMVLTAVALLVQEFVHNPAVQAVDKKAIILLLALGAGSVGQSSSGVSPAVAPAVAKP